MKNQLPVLLKRQKEIVGQIREAQDYTRLYMLTTEFLALQTRIDQEFYHQEEHYDRN